MSTQSLPATKPRAKARTRLAISCGAAVVVLAAMALSTRVVKLGAPGEGQPGVFSPAAYGAAEFPKVKTMIEGRAVDAGTLADALAKDPAAAAKQYGTPVGSGSEIPVTFTGVVGQGDSGVYEVKVPRVPDGTKVRVQTGPAIMGTDLRDATGTISFGQFTNQIEYQNAGAALNKEMKKQVLSKVDVAKLTGKTVTVTGVFLLNDPASWLVTPVAMSAP